eukprot:CAMPEP_0172387858 /NCGR_PEP_ID=MMETSP1061-20121228/5073_1 /TAXON_ID=37318 /ORGANISM="Pseudo-nitzschia pungens, Strain cf. pungens" /LENGTH=190 /DNA_ID=CAMNT_0013117601 /DNA_START=10 /DNA_END=579 /DNA_ORIENTATION=-
MTMTMTKTTPPPNTTRTTHTTHTTRTTRNSGPKSPDVVDRFFNFAENAFCQPRDAKSLARERTTEPDVLDYVFERVESLTCAEESSSSSLSPSRSKQEQQRQEEEEQQEEQQEELQTEQQQLQTKDPQKDRPYISVPQPPGLYDYNPSFDAFSIHRDNSLVETGPSGEPQWLELELEVELDPIRRQQQQQ